MSGRNRRALLRGVCEGGDLPGGAMVDLTGTKLETVDTARTHLQPIGNSSTREMAILQQQSCVVLGGRPTV
jgi:hypothetical protein